VRKNHPPKEKTTLCSMGFEKEKHKSKPSNSTSVLIYRN
jgi:hypothetical protein